MEWKEQLSLIGLLPVLRLSAPDQAVPVCQALARAEVPAAAISFSVPGAEKALALIRDALPDFLLAAWDVTTLEQARSAAAAGAQAIAAASGDIAAFCAEKGLIALPLDEEALLGLGNPQSPLTLLPLDEALLGAGNPDMIEAWARSAVDKKLNLALKHVGINSGSPEKALADAEMLCKLLHWNVRVGGKSTFAGSAFECMKLPFRGTHGHVAISTDSVPQAIWHLERRGFPFDMSSAGFKEGRMTAVYLQDEIAGLAFHLLQN